MTRSPTGLIVRYDENGDEESSENVTFNLSDFDIENDFEMDGDTLSIDEIEIDYKDKTVTIR